MRNSPFVTERRIAPRTLRSTNPLRTGDSSTEQPSPTTSRKPKEASRAEVVNVDLARLPLPPEIEDSRVGARLGDFAPQWRNLLGEHRAWRTLKEGVRLTWMDSPPLTRRPIAFPTKNSKKDLQKAVQSLLDKGAVERVIRTDSRGFFSRLFLVPKKTGDMRPVIDLSSLNRHLVIPHFKMETQASVRAAVRPGEWAVSVDIRDAYLHVPMSRAVRSNFFSRSTVESTSHLSPV